MKFLRWIYRLRYLFATVALLAVLVSCATNMPGRSFSGALPPLPQSAADLEESLRADIEMLSVEIGQRNTLLPQKLDDASRYLESELLDAGYEVEHQTYKVRGVACRNLIAERRGASRPDNVVIVGAHYDSAVGTPGANDNGSGTASLLALARRFASATPERTLRFVLFTNEEPPWFQTEAMGSWLYAKRCQEKGEEIAGMLSLETMGYFSDEPGSQDIPTLLRPFYPSTGNFIAFVSNFSSRNFLKKVVGEFRAHTDFPSRGGALPEWIPGVGFSDQWSFWRHGFPAVMVTDTAFARYPHYHLRTDTVDKVDIQKLARVVDGLVEVLRSLGKEAVDG